MGGLVPGPPRTPKSTSAQVPYIKQHNIYSWPPVDSEPQIKRLIFHLQLTEYEDARLGDMEGLIFVDKSQHTSGLCSSNHPCSGVNGTSFVYAHTDLS